MDGKETEGNREAREPDRGSGAGGGGLAVIFEKIGARILAHRETGLDNRTRMVTFKE